MTEHYRKILEKDDYFDITNFDASDPLSFYGQSPQKPSKRRFIRRKDEYLPVFDIPEFKAKIIRYSGGYEDFGNKSFMVYGDPGMGKSAIMKSCAKELCSLYNQRDGTNRKFIDFESVAGSESKVKEVLDNPEQYYVFITLSMSMIRAHEMKGIPGMSDDPESSVVRTLLDPWMAILNTEGLAGMLFLDELNQAAVPTQTTIYGLIHHTSRMLNSHTRIANAKRWSVHAAGNLPEDDLGGVEKFLEALRARFASCWLEVTYPSWREWAESDDAVEVGVNFLGETEERPIIHPYLLKFLDYAYDLYNPQPGVDSKFKRFFNARATSQEGVLGLSPNPRAFELVSGIIYNVTDNDKRRLMEINKEIAKGDLNPNYETKLQKEGKNIIETWAARVYDEATEHINVDWCKKFGSFLRADRQYLLSLFNNPNDPDFDEKIASQYTIKKVGAKIKGVSTVELTNNIGVARDIVTSLVEEILFLSGYVTTKNGSVKLVKSPDISNLESNKENRQAVYNKIFALFKAIGVLRQHANDVAAIIYSYYQGYTAGGKLEEGAAPKVMHHLLNTVFTKPEAERLMNASKSRSVEFFTKDQIASARQSIQDKLDEDESDASYSEDEEGTEGTSVQFNSQNSIENDNEWLEKAIDYLEDALG